MKTKEQIEEQLEHCRNTIMKYHYRKDSFYHHWIEILEWVLKE